MHICFRCFSLVYLLGMLVVRSVAAELMWSMDCGLQPPHQLAALFNCFVLLPNYLSRCNALQLLRYNTTLNAFGKAEFHLVGYIYSITTAQQAKLK